MSNTKICKRCGEAKDVSAFYRWATHCKPCYSLRGREWQKANKDKVAVIHRKAKLKAKYGLTPSEYEAMLLSQGGRCKICDNIPGRRPLDVDHSHASNKIRGLLCEACNKGLGIFQDDPVLLEKAMRYLIENTTA